MSLAIRGRTRPLETLVPPSRRTSTRSWTGARDGADEATGPNFGSDALQDTMADTPAPATFMSEQTRLIRPAGHGLRRIPVTDPTPVHPHPLLWHRDNPRPALATLCTHLVATASGRRA